MQTKFKRHQKVRLLVNPDPEYIEYHTENLRNEGKDLIRPITNGMIGKINIILPNGQYHVEVFDENSGTIAYVLMSEEQLEAIE